MEPTNDPRQARTRPVRLVVICAVLVLVAFFIFLPVLDQLGRTEFKVAHPETGFTFPDPQEIASIRAVHRVAGDTADFPEFDVPDKHWPSILSALAPSERDPHPTSWVALGSLTIRRKDGQQIVVNLYGTGEKVGAFSAGPSIEQRVYYRGGDTLQLRTAIEAAYAEARKSLPAVETKKTPVHSATEPAPQENP